MSQRRRAILATKVNNDAQRVLRKRDPPPPPPPTLHAGGVIVYSPVLPHGFAARLEPGPVDATTAARAAFSVSCLRSAGPICRNVLGPLAHTLGRYFAGGGFVSVVTRAGVPHNHESLNAVLVWRRPATRPGEGERAARRWLASCAIAQADSVRWHPRRFVPCDAALDLVYFYLAEAAAPASLLRSTCGEMCAWLARSGALLTRLAQALTYAETDDAICPIDVRRLTTAFDAMRRRHTGPQRNSRHQQRPSAARDLGNEVECDVETVGCGCPSPRVCTAWGPERSVGAWQRSAFNSISFVAATPARAIDPAHLRLGYSRSAVLNDDDTNMYCAYLDDAAVDSATTCGVVGQDRAYGGQQQQHKQTGQSLSDTMPTTLVPCPYSIPVNVKTGGVPCLGRTVTSQVAAGSDACGDDSMWTDVGDARDRDDHTGRCKRKRHRTDANTQTCNRAVDDHGDDDGPPAGTADLGSTSGVDHAIDSDDFWEWINQQFSTDIDALF
ncbi:hypothetical protein pneo_cds_259 [Pandoravirus neocaledonia]|uniref:Uncharacterized protein n=1 Tax=Pandoravirus neocaledonia TaxID=2107708 RepID=A0A2U7UBQ0_9VIRU|nr:hypothetical protein pneo_cds_259 [Pandoravirus neocaledonia]AVK75866.1 hypothetical protein pneo_cds_259 [Pandoravirus neocaledonia]